MSADAVLVVADTLRNHGFGHTEESRVSSRTVDHCRCGWRSTFEHRTHAAHVAAAVVDALGGLEREYGEIPESFNTGRLIPNPVVMGEEMLPDLKVRFIPCHRWVSGWAREPAEEGQA